MKHNKMEEGVPESTNSRDIVFTSKHFPELARIFKEVSTDEGRGLDIETFCEAMKQLYPNANDEDLHALHMKIDANCNDSVALGDLLDYVNTNKKAAETLDPKYQLFPKPFEIIPTDHYENKRIVTLICCPLADKSIEDDMAESSEQTRPYQKCWYISVTCDGVLKFWSDGFKSSDTFPLNENRDDISPFSNKKKVHVNDMVYIKELNEVAVCTSERELLFYSCKQPTWKFGVGYSITEEENFVNVLNYWSDGTKAMFAFGDSKGFLSVFITYNLKHGLFCDKAFEKISLKSYKTAYVSTLLKNHSKDFNCFRIPIFDSECSQLMYFPHLKSYAICDGSSELMVLTSFSFPSSCKKPIVSQKVFKSLGHHEFFSCVEYSPWSNFMLTGGTDGLLRVWFPFKNTSCALELKGHKAPVTHLAHNSKENIFISVSADQNVHVWSDGDWICRQSFFVDCLSKVPIISLCYNTQNNELFLANSDIARCLGRGTDVFKNALTSHFKPVCCMLYHSIFKQIVSVCEGGVVTVWDVFTGKAVMQFLVTSDDFPGHIAMSFDQPQRKLITIDHYGHINLWNFNNGTKLSSISVTVPNKVTSILSRKDRLFVSAKNCDILFDLDINKSQHRFWNHHLLKDIASVDVHEPTLVTGSSTGNIVIWNLDTTEVLFYLNTSDNPRALQASESDQGQITTTRVKQHKSLKQKKEKETCVKEEDIAHGFHFICLKTREVTSNTATVLTTKDGYIFAWSVLIKGGLLGKFRAFEREGVFITSMVMDMKETILVTGDSIGRVCLWNISNFGFKTRDDKGPFENIQGWPVSLCPPPLLSSWQAHASQLVSVACDPLCSNIITAGVDCNVKLWTNSGKFVGLFGKDKWVQSSTQPKPKDESEQEEDEKTQTLLESPPLSPLLAALSSPLSASDIDRRYSIKAPIKPIINDVEFPRYAALNGIHANLLDIKSELISWKKECRECKKDPITLKYKGHCVEQYPNICKRQKKTPKKRRPASTNKYSNVRSRLSTQPCLVPGNIQFRSHPSQTPNTTGQDSTVEQGSEQRSRHGQLPPIAAKGQNTQLTRRQPLTPPSPGQSRRKILKDIIDKPESENVLPTLAAKGQLPQQNTQITPHRPVTPPSPRQSRRKIRKDSTDKPESKNVLLPPVPGKVQLPPLPPRTPHTTGKDSTVKQGSKQRSRHGQLPPIAAKGQLPQQNTQLTPHPPLTPPNPGQSRYKILKDSTDKPESKNVLLPPVTGKVQLPPLPPRTPHTTGQDSTVKQGSKKSSRHGQLPTFADKGQLLEQIAQLTPHPPVTPPNPGQSRQKILKDSTDKPESKNVLLPPVPGKVQLPPLPPRTPHTTGQDSTVKQGSKQRSRNGQLPTLAAKGQLPEQNTQLTPHPPLTPPSPGQSSRTPLKDSTDKPEFKRVLPSPILKSHPRPTDNREKKNKSVHFEDISSKTG